MRYLLVCFLSASTVMAVAQNIYNSPYSAYGFGLINDRLSTLNRSMAGTGIGVRDRYNLNYENPASLGSIMSPVSSIFEMGFYIEHNNHQTKQASESRRNGSLSNINYWFKLMPRWASTIGLTPFSSVSYNINTTRPLGGFSDVGYQYEGSGTISRLYWGNGFNITKNLSLGFNLSYLFGSITKTESINFADQSGDLLFENKIFTNKGNIDGGLQYVIPFRKNASLVIGLVAENDVTLSASQKNYLLDSALDTLNKSTDEKLQYSVPAKLGIGIALHKGSHIFASDLEFENWRAISLKDEDIIYHDVWKFSFGYMYGGNPDASSYLGSASLRAGFHVQQHYLQVKENILPRWGLNMGLSLPMFDNRSSVNLTYALHYIGTTKDGLILQRAQQVMIDVVIRDLWGRQRRFE